MPFPSSLTPQEAIRLQQDLRTQILLEPLTQTPKTLAGVDASLNRFSTTVFAGWVVLSYPDLALLDQACVQQEVTFPYIPGLLSFREIPPLLAAWRQLTIKPELVMVDGAGIAHPRRLGIAAHLGLELDLPTIGCAKSRLFGIGDMPDEEQGSVAPLFADTQKQELLGYRLRSKRGANPLYISPGHHMDAPSSLHIVQTCLRGYRLPEPTRLAHLYTNQVRRDFYQQQAATINKT